MIGQVVTVEEVKALRALRNGMEKLPQDERSRVLVSLMEYHNNERLAAGAEGATGTSR